MTIEEHIKEAEKWLNKAERSSSSPYWIALANMHLQIAMVKGGGTISLDKP